MEWILKQEKVDTKLMASVLGIGEITAQALANRGIKTKNTAIKYLNPSLKFLYDGFQMKHMQEAVDLALKSIRAKDKIVIYGDYDVDGVSSTVILLKALKKLNADVSYYVPSREEEGYGLNMSAVKKLKNAEVDLIIACDNGIAALNEVLEIKRLGMKIIILDHHQPGFVESENGRVDVIPLADCVVDPKQTGCPYPFKGLCAGAISYKFALKLLEAGGITLKQQEEDELLIFASIATVCDVVDLLDENRIIARNGIAFLNENKDINIGLKALIKEKNLYERTLSVFDIGFIIGPCINATGRLSKATMSIDLFLTDSPEEGDELAKSLSQLNDKRREITRLAVEAAQEEVINSDLASNKVLVIYNEDIHESIAGIVAGRIKEQLNRPTIVLTKGEQHVKGSARSIYGYNIFEALYANRHLFIAFGGHPMAAGLTIPYENIEALRFELNSQCTLTESDYYKRLFYDMELELSQATYKLGKELELLAPFGKENKEPLFLSKEVTVLQLRTIPEKDTIIFSLEVANTNREIKAVCFGYIDELKRQFSTFLEPYDAEKAFKGVLRNFSLKMDIIYSIEINIFRDNVNTELRIKDFIIYNL